MAKRVLIVEDDADVRESLRESLEEEGYAVLGVASGREGLEAIAQESFCLVISDYYMADMNGGVFVRTVLERHPGVHQVLLTGADKKTVSMIGVPVLYKPVDYDSLMQVLERHCGHQRLGERNPQMAESALAG